MYQLMCKDTVLAEFELSENNGFESLKYLKVISTLPFGVTEYTFYTWLDSRKAFKHKRELSRALVELGYEGIDGFLRATHGISINDCNWVREAGENVGWADVSPYRNNFDAIVQKLAFLGTGVPGDIMSTTSPEFTTDGAFRKCWINEGNSVYLIKRGNDTLLKRGLEAYSEVLASAVYARMKAGISYDLINFHGYIASKCKLFTSEEESFVQFRNLHSNHNLENIVRYYDSLGSDIFRRILICDAIVLNTDRHTGNHGVLYDPLSHKYSRTAPGFDYNLALCPNLPLDEFTQFSDTYWMYQSHHGVDFVKSAHNLLTDDIRKDLLDLRGIKLSLPSEDIFFTEERCEILTKIVNVQIDNILNNTHDMCNFNVSSMSDIVRYRIKNNITPQQWRDSESVSVMQKLNVSFIEEIEREIHKLL